MAEQPKKGRLTLYEDLLSKETREEMAAKDAAKIAEANKKKKDVKASLMFKPSFLGKKPSQPKAKPKPNFSSMHKVSSSVSMGSAASGPPPTEDSPDKEPPSSTAQPKLTQKRGFNDWLANDEEEDFYFDRPRQEQGGRKKKKKKAQHEQQQPWSWDDIYDPTLPVPFQDYRRSDVEYDINDEWKRRLYEAHKREQRRQGKDVRRQSSEENSYRPRMGMGQQFTTTGGLGFAPPPDFDPPSSARTGSSDPYSGRSSPRRGNGRDYDDGPRVSFAPPPPAASLNLDESADDAYARRMALSGMGATPAQSALPLPPQQMLPGLAPMSVTPPNPANLDSKAAVSDDKKARVAAQIAAMKARIGKPAATPPASAPAIPAPPPTDSPRTQQFIQDTSAPPPPPPEPAAPPGVISGGPTYNPEYLAQKARTEAEAAAETVEPATEAPGEEVSAERSSRPGQSGFAERLMKKLGWEKGQGLGASGEGITTAIYAKAEKRKKKGDAQGGGFATPVNMGKIVGGKKAKHKANATGESSAEGTPKPQVEDDPTKLSEVVKLEGMLENLDVDHEISENNLMQEIGDEMGEHYGQVERLYVWRKHAGGQDDVFVKFKDAVSAAKCMHGMDGTEFADNQVRARFWSVAKFENGEYA